MKKKIYYKIKPQVKNELKKMKLHNRDIAEIVGVTEGYISQIINIRKLDISKTLAYAICKAISPDLEIADVFDIIEK